MKRIRAGSGLGDSIYLQSVVRHLVSHGEQLEVCTNFPAVFRPLAGEIQLAPFTRTGVHLVAHYTARKGVPGTSQFRDMCLAAGIHQQVDLQLDWKVENTRLTDEVTESGKPVVCVQLPRTPMGRTDGFGAELLPDCRVLQQLIDQLRGSAFLVQVGAGDPLHRFEGIDLDLSGKTNVSELLDVSSVAAGFLGYCSFIVPIAESFSKPALLVWARKGLKSPVQYVSRITPQKVLHKPSSLWVVDDWTEETTMGVLDAFSAAIRSRGAVSA